MGRRRMKFGFDRKNMMPWLMCLGSVVILVLCALVWNKVNNEGYHLKQMNSQDDINRGCYGGCPSCIGKGSQVMGCVSKVNQYETSHYMDGGEVFGSDNIESDNLQAEWCCCGNPTPNYGANDLKKLRNCPL